MKGVGEFDMERGYEGMGKWGSVGGKEKVMGGEKED